MAGAASLFSREFNHWFGEIAAYDRKPMRSRISDGVFAHPVQRKRQIPRPAAEIEYAGVGAPKYTPKLVRRPAPPDAIQ